MPPKLEPVPGYYPFTESSPCASRSMSAYQVGQENTTAYNRGEQSSEQHNGGQPAKRTLPGHEHVPEPKRQKPATEFKDPLPKMASSPATHAEHASKSAPSPVSFAEKGTAAATPSKPANAPAVTATPPPSSNTPNSPHGDTTSITRECEDQPTDAKQLEQIEAKIEDLEKELQAAKAQVKNHLKRTVVLKVDGSIKSIRTDGAGQMIIEIEGSIMRSKWETK